ncbi:MAG TPA: deoxyribodipyrimidine photo-lyase [Casimicrobiaceae bacterium]|nr:deoxyribodipyrimidine photo-lyase [Casimicrobiaceae bacterium]
MRHAARGALVWFRRDLRDFDHAALANALAGGPPVYAAFVFDREILDTLPSRTDRRVEFIHGSVRELDRALRKRGGALIVTHAHSREAIPRLARNLKIAAVYCNHDYEPVAIDRDRAVSEALARDGIAFHTFKDQVIFERDEVLSRAGTPFSVFAPYKKSWLERLRPDDVAARDVDEHAKSLRIPPAAVLGKLPTLQALGFRTTDLAKIRIKPGMSGGAERFRRFKKEVDDYRVAREKPALDRTSHLSVHLRFGTVSVRELAAFAHARLLAEGSEGAATWLSELVWRDFFAQILWHHPRVVDHAFRPVYDALPFPNEPERLDAWCKGRTGYPIVDAAMRQLLTTGFMHNRMRMVTASFLVKDLLVDWRIGERHFADCLIDYELASNNGGWQWAASTGCDAQPYFRIFNPVSQSERFDAEGAFIRRFVPELKRLEANEIHAPWRLLPETQRRRGVVIGCDYPPPIVDHAVARAEALALFKAARLR